MPRIAYVNGSYVRHAEAAVHIEDRGYQFADGVYEVVPVHHGRLLDAGPHLDRLDRSLKELSIAWPMARRALEVVVRRIITKNLLTDGLVYIQVTRGVAPRDHAFPTHAESSIVVTAKRKRFEAAQVLAGVSVITIPDIRWKRCDIKSLSLLANVLGKQRAVEEGAFEAWMVDAQGQVTEGTASNAWIVTGDGVLVTRQLSENILGGITRRAVLDMAAKEGLAVEERPFSVEEAKAAREAFITSATSYVKPVIAIDGETVADGKAGALSRKLLDAYLDYAEGP